MNPDAAPAPRADSEYQAQLARARTMLSALAAMLECHARDHAKSEGDDHATELDAFCAKLGEAAIWITTIP